MTDLAKMPLSELLRDFAFSARWLGSSAVHAEMHPQFAAEIDRRFPLALVAEPFDHAALRELQRNALPSNCTRCGGVGAEPPGCPESGPCEWCGGWTAHKRLVASETDALRAELEAARKALVDIAHETGAMISPECSTAFLCNVPAEVRGVLSKSATERDALRSRLAEVERERDEAVTSHAKSNRACDELILRLGNAAERASKAEAALDAMTKRAADAARVGGGYDAFKRIGEHIGVDMADLFWNGKADAIIAEITRFQDAAKLPACPVSRDVLEMLDDEHERGKTVAMLARWALEVEGK